MVDLRTLYAAHIEWLGQRPSLTGQEKRHFYRWAARAHADAFGDTIRSNAVVFRQQCMDIQRGHRPPRIRTISYKTLQKYADELTTKYLTLGKARQTSFADFLDEVTSLCSTEGALRRYLELPPL